MQTVVLSMRRKAIAQSLMQMLQEKVDFRIYHVIDYECTGMVVKNREANLALIEVAEAGACDVRYCLGLCARLRQEAPACKLMLMCSEQDKNSIHEVVKAKKKRQIDEFVFYDTSVDYLATKLLSM